jgi:hypothetical protein
MVINPEGLRRRTLRSISGLFMILALTGIFVASVSACGGSKPAEETAGEGLSSITIMTSDGKGHHIWYKIHNSQITLQDDKVSPNNVLIIYLDGNGEYRGYVESSADESSGWLSKSHDEAYEEAKDILGQIKGG